jgi:hypothetical protein
MSEDSNTYEQEAPKLSHTRILILMAAVIVIGTTLGFLYRSPRFGLGFLVGGILAEINYFWLKSALGGIFEKAIRDGKKPRFLISRYLLRYVFVALALILIYVTKVVDFGAVIAGLVSLAIAVTIEGIIRLFLIVFNRKEI